MALLAGILILLFWWNPVIATGRPAPVLILILVLAIGMEALRRQMIREFPDHVSTGTPEGIAQSLADRMREARERRVAGRAAPTEALPGALSGASRLEELERLAKLQEQGVLTSEELAAEKARILSGSEPDAARPGFVEGERRRRGRSRSPLTTQELLFIQSRALGIAA